MISKYLFLVLFANIKLLASTVCWSVKLMSMGPWVHGSMGYLDWPYSYQINLHAVNEIMHGECLQFVMTNESIAKTGANSVKLYA